MSRFTPPSNDLLKDKVVVVTGGALGIGASLVSLLHEAGAHVFFGDIDASAGESLQKRLSSSSHPTFSTSTDQPKLQFLRTDVTDYADNLRLFDAALTACGRIDHAVAAAGIVEIGNIVDPKLDLETVKQPPPTKVLDVNLLGTIYFARIASVYLRQGQPTEKGARSPDRSLVLVSSIAGLVESPGLFVYQASKHGVVGLMRSLRRYLPTSSPQPIRINCVNPWFTRTRMVAGIEEAWDAAGLPANTPMDVAKVIAGVMADPSLNGAALYIEGGRAWNVEQNITKLMPQWLGEKNAKSFEKGQEVLGSGEDWTKSK